MRRVLLIFLLLVLPLQASWAAVCSYCGDECMSERAAATWHDAEGEGMTGSVGVLEFMESIDSDCGCCHFGGAGALAMPAVPPAVMQQQAQSALASMVFLGLIRPARPERPKWLRAA